VGTYVTEKYEMCVKHACYAVDLILLQNVNLIISEDSSGNFTGRLSP